MAHPQSSPRGFIATKRLDVGLTQLSANSTGVTLNGALFISGQATVGKLSANSTAIVLPASGLQMAALSSLKITSNSTGIRIGSRYISTNTTSNSIT